MKLKTEYKEMTNEELLDELKRRIDAFGNSLPTYSDGHLKARYRGIDFDLLVIEDDRSLKIFPTFRSDIDRTIVIKPKYYRYRDIIIGFLQSPFIITGAGEREESQQDFLEDLDEDWFVIEDSEPLEPIIDDVQ